MLDERIEELKKRIYELEDELHIEMEKKKKEFYYELENGKVKFEKQFIKEGRATIESSIKYLSSYPILAILTIPFIWMMIIPAVIADFFVTIYQWICFPIYKIPKVKRSEYIVIDRYNLFYLDKVEKVNCLYCEYFNGVSAYVREVSARTEQFWCPIKHSHTPKDTHSRYDKFFDYGDYMKYRDEIKERRSDFKDVENTPS